MALAPLAMSATVVPAVGQPPSAPALADDSAERQAAALVAQMTADEKAAQMVNSAPAIPRLGVPAYQWWTEALHGAMSDRETTNFPEPIGLAATLNDALIKDVASAISTEVRAIHANARAEGRGGQIGKGNGLAAWSPNINIFRDPRWGRGQETYGEDPFLTAKLGVAYIEGMQGPDPMRPHVIATPKHFAVHSGPESTRNFANVTVSAHDLEDTYLPAFRAAIIEGGAGSIMCAYNAVNGQPACANEFLLQTKLRKAWGFEGYVVSDCGAVRDLFDPRKFVPDAASAGAVAIKSGVDLECISGPNRYAEVLAKGLLKETDLDRALTRLFAARIRTGDLQPGGRAAAPSKPDRIIMPGHRELGLRSAEQSMVLLKNDGVLPLASTARKIVVTGPLADSLRVLRGNYSSAEIVSPVSVLEGIRKQFPQAQVIHSPVGPSYTDGEPVPPSAFVTPAGQEGIQAEFYAVKPAGANARDPGHHGPAQYDDTPYLTKTVEKIGKEHDPATRGYRVVFSGFIVPPETGTYRIGMRGANATLTLDGKPVSSVGAEPVPLGDLKTVRLEKGRRHAFRIEALKTNYYHSQLVWARVADNPAAELNAAARDADLIIAAVGLTSDLEGEEQSLEIPGFSGGDRTTIDLPADQQQILKEAKATGKPLVVVNMSGSAMNLGWADDNANAVLQAWYPGEEGGTAIARVLAGAVNPAGRLPVTFYRSVGDLPAFDNYDMTGRTYRYFSGRPLYPFGHGLSYTTFNYGPLQLGSVGRNGDVTVTTRLTNSGKRPGDEVAQLYLRFPTAPGNPHVALRGFKRVNLAPGESRNVVFQLSARDLSTVSLEGDRRALAGVYQVHVGGGQPEMTAGVVSGRLRLKRQIDVTE
ncbi:glycoside hydrolase family 3 C-terminal domain-containing protein [Novosphingobium sp. M1R2S20]|uniref:Glycoside hydrolase family 3 C-terminal domain-containing protein n=1 Tax=Novosphingobium rhizovicinum TaxID=3228928 RepID=A0ABV3REV8_9SPHN